MASLFDSIFQTSGDEPANSLFSSSNKFKTARTAEGPVAEVTASQSDATTQALTASVSSAKHTGKGNKRKAATAEPHRAEAAHKRPKAVCSDSSSNGNKGSKQKLQKPDTAAAGEPRPKKRKRSEVSASIDCRAIPAAADPSNVISNVQEAPADALAADEATVKVIAAADQGIMSKYHCPDD